MKSMASTMRGRVCVVTGATDGIGRHTAEKLAAAGARVVVHGRNEASAREAAERVANATGAERTQVSCVHADLSALEEVRGLAEQIRGVCDSVDVLVLNAGVYAPQRQVSKDGYELTWAVNVLSPYALVAHTADLLVRGDRPRVVVTSSISQGGARENHVRHVLQDARGDAGPKYDGHASYALSKLSDAILAMELSERLQGIATVNSLDPGTVNTKMLLAGWGPIGIEVNDADAELYLSTSEEVEGITGKYFVNNRESRASSLAYDPEIRASMWTLWEKQTGVSFPTLERR
uniref:Ketoreductase domain-containing protein n=1 Tax=Picocystis salinarum TaxID=88271 RepID=A0A7S3XFM6_9CHLO|mmetsp:Transcript_7888/g.48780  ORF Transcript_7888/g.48780 Transcript_7888/m.48780 type:complete len:291 (-) Transcript_7888:78-950(-)